MHVRRTLVVTLVAIGPLTIPATPLLAGANAASRKSQSEVGRELFQRQWTANDPRAHGGDGLGPVFNARSCAECHHQGGPGGAGSNAHDVEIAAPVARRDLESFTRPSRSELESFVRTAGILAKGSFVLHRSGTDIEYAAWRTRVTKKPFDRFTIETASRNTPGLFGASLIDAIPDRVLNDASTRRYPNFPRVHGRVNRLRDGRIGRFGWKAQTATLREFVLTACSIELGLEVPGHPQATDPRKPKSTASGLDMNQAECDALLAFVGSLPPPVRASPPTPDEDEGAKIFQTIGCATCHTPNLGNAKGLFSDLLLHDLGPEVNDAIGRLGYPGSEPAPAEPPSSIADFRLREDTEARTNQE
jgi:CxxC motif-containing protein (DUF1111 family)